MSGRGTTKKLPGNTKSTIGGIRGLHQKSQRPKLATRGGKVAKRGLNGGKGKVKCGKGKN